MNQESIIPVQAESNSKVSPDELQTLKERVWMHSNDIIYFHEVVNITPLTINVMFDEINEYRKNMKRGGLLVDLRDAYRPDAETRRTINTRFRALADDRKRTNENDIEHVSFVSGKNILINTAAKFVMYKTNLNSYSIHKSLEAGIEKIKQVAQIK